MRVIFAGGGTGGHLFPGLAVAREFQRRAAATEILFVGTEQGIEFRVLPKEGFKLATLTVKGLKGRGLRGVFDALYGVPASLLRSRSIIRRFRPDCIVGLGGYASGPLLLAGRLARIRCAIMEQNLRPGFTNKLLARWVDRVFTAYRESANYFPRARVVETGNPVRWQKLPEVAKRAKFSLLVFGGSAQTTDGSQGRAVRHASDRLGRFRGDQGSLCGAALRGGGDSVHRSNGSCLRAGGFGLVSRRCNDGCGANRFWQSGDSRALSVRHLRSSARQRAGVTRPRRRGHDPGSRIDRRNFGRAHSELSVGPRTD